MFSDRDSQTDIKTSIMNFQVPDSERSIRLIVLSGLDRGREIVAVGPFVSVGRSAECSFVLKDQTVSRRHFSVTETDGGWVIEDAGSGNGTSLNGNKINREKLKNGDRISAGNTVIKVDNVDLWTRAEVSIGHNEPPARDVMASTRRDDEHRSDDIQEIHLGTPGPIGKRYNEGRNDRIHPLVFPGVVILLLLLFLGTYYARSCGYIKSGRDIPANQQTAPEPQNPDTTIRIPLPMEVTPPSVIERPTDRPRPAEKHTVLTPEQSFRKAFEAGNFVEAGRINDAGQTLTNLADQCEATCNQAVEQTMNGGCAGVERDLADLAVKIEQNGLKVPQRINSLRAECMALMGKIAANGGKDAAAADMARRALSLDPKCEPAKTLQNDVSNRAAMYFNRALDALRQGRQRQAALDFTTVTRILPEDHRLHQAAVARMP